MSSYRLRKDQRDAVIAPVKKRMRSSAKGLGIGLGTAAVAGVLGLGIWKQRQRRKMAPYKIVVSRVDDDNNTWTDIPLRGHKGPLHQWVDPKPDHVTANDVHTTWELDEVEQWIRSNAQSGDLDGMSVLALSMSPPGVEEFVHLIFTRHPDRVERSIRCGLENWYFLNVFGDGIGGLEDHTSKLQGNAVVASNCAASMYRTQLGLDGIQKLYKERVAEYKPEEQAMSAFCNYIQSDRTVRTEQITEIPKVAYMQDTANPLVVVNVLFTRHALNAAA